MDSHYFVWNVRWYKKKNDCIHTNISHTHCTVSSQHDTVLKKLSSRKVSKILMQCQLIISLVREFHWFSVLWHSYNNIIYFALCTSKENTKPMKVVVFAVALWYPRWLKTFATSCYYLRSPLVYTTIAGGHEMCVRYLGFKRVIPMWYCPSQSYFAGTK